MKLIFCPTCGDIFKLTFENRSCECGRASGRYINCKEAVTNGGGYSLAIGNGSLADAMRLLAKSPCDADRSHFIENNKVICWMRPNDGPGNPHSKIEK